MRQRMSLAVLRAAAAIAVSLCGLAQAGQPQPSAAAAKPPAPPRDLSGVWTAAGISPIGFSDKHPGFTPAGEKLFRANKPGRGITEVAVALANDPLDSCDPAGFPRNEIFEFRAFQIAPLPDRYVFAYQYQRVWRAVYTDGRPLPKDPDPTFYGYSVGKWIDDYTFVIDTVGLDERTWIDNSGLPHSAKLHVTERFHRVDRDTIELTLTLDDPEVYVKPWNILTNHKITSSPRLEIPDMICVPTEMEQYKKLVAEPAAGVDRK